MANAAYAAMVRYEESAEAAHSAVIDAAEADTAAENFEACIDDARHYLDRAIDAWERGQRAAACDLLMSARTVLDGATDIDTTTAADAPDAED